MDIVNEEIAGEGTVDGADTDNSSTLESLVEPDPQSTDAEDDQVARVYVDPDNPRITITVLKPYDQVRPGQVVPRYRGH